ncbi:MAG: hypothetical protein F4X26_00615 [Chloroflexi bacterium]|nr:hypothetical protein [Chloroflexota bacterium]MYD64496.1 hypothetical protein [Chloroflexota bacterium]
MSTEVSFELPEAALAAHRWRLACEGDAQPHPPLIAELYADLLGEHAVVVGGYLYERADTPANGEHGAPGALDRLHNEWLPRVEELASALGEVDPAALDGDALTALIERWREVAAGLRDDVLDPARGTADAFVAGFVARFGDDRRSAARSLIDAIPSRASRRAAVVWEMSRLLRSQGSRLSATFGPTGGQREYMQLRQRAQRDFPHAVPGYRQDVPSWSEDHAMVTSAVRQAAAMPDAASPIQAEQRRRAERNAAQAELAASATEPRVAALMAQLPGAQEHALALDALAEPTVRLIAAARAMWLGVGAWLVAGGAVAEPADVFYLHRGELVTALHGGDGPGSGSIRERRAAHAASEEATPPATLGGA